eukprot:m.269738 g.269738  ORF g.269738 m.269738 type:complete len:53 (-) comp80184_c0_seq1:13-171(-)
MRHRVHHATCVLYSVYSFVFGAAFLLVISSALTGLSLGTDTSRAASASEETR